MQLASLNPTMAGCSGGLNEFSFDCPKCGPPYRVVVRCRLNGPSDADGAIWAWKPPKDVNANPWGLTFDPSISNHNHGRKKPCSCHVTIENGEVKGA